MVPRELLGGCTLPPITVPSTYLGPRDYQIDTIITTHFSNTARDNALNQYHSVFGVPKLVPNLPCIAPLLSSDLSPCMLSCVLPLLD